MIKTWLTIMVSLAGTIVVPAETLLHISWPELQAQGKLGAVKVTGDAIEIENTQRQALTVHLFTVDTPPITTSFYALEGDVRYDQVEGAGYLELWNYFPDGGAFFSRTLGDRGATGALSGSSSGRSFVLPFFNRKGGTAPSKLELNLVLPGPGKVYVGPCRLVQYDSAAAANRVWSSAGDRGAWWSDRQAGLMGGVGGALIGCLGALMGVLCSMGKARGLVMVVANALILFGVACLAAGLVAVVCSQPYAVYYPLLLAGLICTIVVAFNKKTIRKRYEEKELRKMQSLDAA